MVVYQVSSNSGVRHAEELIERIKVARSDPYTEPSQTLCRGSVREAVRHNPASGLLLKGVVANGSRSPEAFFDITRLDHLTL